MRRNDPISRLLTPNAVSVQVGQPLSAARQTLAAGSFRHLPVVDGSKLVGILSATDMMRLSFDAFGADDRTMDHVLDEQFKLADVMTADPVTMQYIETVRDAVEKLSDGKFNSLPVVDESGNLLGIVTSTDLIRYLGAQY